MRQKATIALGTLALLISASLLSGCYTTQGAGRDLQAAGKGISNESAEHTSYKP